MPRSVVSSVRWRASSWMRWSGLAPISPALTRRKARRGLSHSSNRSHTTPSRSLTLVVWLSQACATFRTKSTAGNHTEDHELDKEPV